MHLIITPIGPAFILQGQTDFGCGIFNPYLFHQFDLFKVNTKWCIKFGASSDTNIGNIL